jgi:hypothetical protein
MRLLINGYGQKFSTNQFVKKNLYNPHIRLTCVFSYVKNTYFLIVCAS